MAEPVGWVKINEVREHLDFVGCGTIYKTSGEDRVPLYTAPPQREWVGLTDKEKNGCLVSSDPCECLATPEAQQLMEDVEAKLKEKNND